MKLNALAKRVHAASREAGWYDNPRSELEMHMLMVSEIAEATEAVRNHVPNYYHVEGKPEGEHVELCDALIRILDYLEFKGANIERIIDDKLAYNKTRGYKHGNKKL